MTLTRIKVGQINGKMEIVAMQTGIIDYNPVVYHGAEDLPITDDDVATGRVKHVGSGFTALQEYINMNDRQKTENPKVNISVRIPLSCADRLRASGRGWQTRTSDYLVEGIMCGVFDNTAV